MRTINIGIVSYGYMGRMHAMCYENLKYYYDMDVDVRLYAVVTSKPAEALPPSVEAVYADYHELLADEKVDVVDICAPNYMHREILVAAIQRGKHIYCEKPLARNLQEADAVTAALRTYNYTKINRIAFEYRFVPAIMRAKRMISEGKIGGLIQFNCKYYGSEFLDPMRPVSWQSTKALAGGGVLYALGTHMIDLIHYLIGAVERVSAEKYTYFDERPEKEHPEVLCKVELEDIVNARLTCENGAVGTLLLSQVAAGAGVDFSFEIYGEKGAIKFDQAQPDLLLYYDAADTEACGYKSIVCAQKYGGKAVFPPPRVSISWIRYHIAGIYEFIHAIETGTPAEPGLLDGYRVQRVTDAIYRSCDSHKTEEV